MSKYVDTKTYNIGEIIKWYFSGEINLSPKFQRNQVWNIQAKSYLVDTILRGLPIPMFFIRQTVDIHINKIYKEVIDGQQRLRAIISYYNDEYSSMEINGSIPPTKYSDLPDDLKEQFLEYEVAMQIVKSKDDAIIYDMFARLNTNNYALNKQEVRNAIFWGEFKNFIYELGNSIRSKLLDWRTLDDRKVMRMKDYELINSFVILLLDGIKNETPKIIDSYYKRYSDTFQERENVKQKFFSFISIIENIVKNGYELNVFNRPTYLYTLFACFLKKNGTIEIKKLIENLSILEDCIENDTPKIELKIISKIKELHRIRTTNSKERTLRVELVYKALFG